MLDGHHGVVIAMKEQSGLREAGERRESSSVADELKIERHLAAFPVMKDRYGAILFPGGEAGRTKVAEPQMVEIESGGEQHEATDFGVV